MRTVHLLIFANVLLWFATSCTTEQKRPNVLFIAVDDLRPELGSYGSTTARTPHMDALAMEGLVFKNHFVQVPTCGASRYSLLTGMRPKSLVHLSNRAIETEISNKPEDLLPETFIHQLKRNGYHTVGIGKISHSADGLLYDYIEEPSKKRELPHSWNELVFDSGKWGTGWNSFFGYANGENRQSLKKNVKPYEGGEVDDEGYVDGLTAKLAISKLQELKNKDKPFFMGVGFFKPHLPFTAPKKYWDLYDRKDITLAPNPTLPEHVNTRSLHGSGEFNQYRLTDEIAGLSQPVSDAYAQKLRHSYMAAVSYVDAQIGKVLNELQSLGLDKNTIVVVWGDHGWHLGDHRVWGKHTLFERALKSVLIIKAPEMGLSEQTVNTIVETVDIYPSLLELCNVNVVNNTDGESFIGLLKNPKSINNEVAYSYYKNGISVRTKDYRLTQYFRKEGPTIELYDHKNDPNETKNIAELQPKIVSKLMPLLAQGDTGLYHSKSNPGNN